VPDHRVVALTPQVGQLTQDGGEELAEEEKLTLLSARFEASTNASSSILPPMRFRSGRTFCRTATCPRWFWSTRLRVVFRARSTRSRGHSKASRPSSRAGSSIRITRAPLISEDGVCRRYSCQATTERSRNGDANRAANERPCDRSLRDARSPLRRVAAGDRVRISAHRARGRLPGRRVAPVA